MDLAIVHPILLMQDVLETNSYVRARGGISTDIPPITKTFSCLKSGWLAEGIRIENPDLRDPVDGKVVPLRSPPDSFR